MSELENARGFDFDPPSGLDTDPTCTVQKLELLGSGAAPGWRARRRLVVDSDSIGSVGPFANHSN